MKTLLVKNIVTGTSTNVEALPLLIEMNNSASNEVLKLSFKDIQFLSSSFLNSSIGEFIDNHGFDFFAKNVKFSDCMPSIATSIKEYVVKYKNRVTK